MCDPRGRWARYKADIEDRLDYAEIFSDIKDPKPSGNGCILGLCPFHDDHNQSFGVSTKTGAWECFAGCGKGDAIAYLMRRDGQSFKEVMHQLGDKLGIPRPDQADQQEVVYSYRDASGKLVFQVVKKPGKKFAQRRPDGNGVWVWNLKGVDRVLYRLPELIARPEATVYIVEGEKDADRLAKLGLASTTNPGGAGKWRETYTEDLRGRDVLNLPDNDAPGRDHALKVAAAVHGVAKTVKIVELPGLREKGDASDWLDAGHTVEDLGRIVDAAPEWSPDDNGGVRPVIRVNGRQLRDVIDDAWGALLAANDPPQLFVTTGGLARLQDADTGPVIQLLDEAAAFGLLVRAADWVRVTAAGTSDVHPPKEIARDILANPHRDLPRLEGVVSTPVFDAAGKLIARPGYHAEARFWLHRPEGEMPIGVPRHPTEEDVEAALRLLREELLVDFPFAAESDEAHALAALILPFVRRMVDGPTPIHLLEAPTPGSGKSLLADLVSIVALGRPCEPTTVTRNEDESRKKLTAILARGRPVVVIDNVQGGLESAQLASAVTAEVWSDRILGRTQMVEFPNRAVWLVTANNPKLSMEIARRCVRVRLEPAEERPWERTGFRHYPIVGWARERRHELVRAVLVLVQNWVAAGKPMAARSLGSFESWAGVVGGILGHVGVRDFLADTDDFYAEADSESGEWRAFVIAWKERYETSPVAPADLMALAEEGKLVPFAYAASSDQARLAKFGKALSGLRDRKFGDVQVVVSPNKKRGSNDYRLVPVAVELFPAEGGS